MEFINDKTYFLFENGIIQEPKVQKLTNNKAYFKMALQDCDVVNRNKRLYRLGVMKPAVTNMEESMQRRSCYCEMDHPIPTSDRNFDAIRQSTVMLKEASHIITAYEWRENVIWGEMETLSTDNGFKLYGLLKDKTGVGTSMRGMAPVSTTSEGIHEVRHPLMIVCWDAVSSPSHTVARINHSEVRFEQFAMSSLQENSSGQTICTPDGKCYLSNYFDKLVESKAIEFCREWV